MYIRAFIAIPLPGPIKQTIARIQDKLKPAGADVSWTTAANIHLTLKFLGEIKENRLERVARALQEAAADGYGYRIRIDTLGAFPSILKPRVIWAGIGIGDNETTRLAARIEETTAAAGIPEEKRPFSSHITIGRMRSSHGHDNLSSSLNSLSRLPADLAAECPVNGFTLYKSTLTPGGPIYEVIREFGLQKK